MNVSGSMNRLLLCCLLTFGFAGSGWLASGRAVAADVPVACTGCHRDKQSFRFVHDPAAKGNCEICHEPTPEHLKKGGPGGMKTDRTTSACIRCHDEKYQGQKVHPVLEMDGMCVRCHNPHGSDIENILVLPMNRLCFECHDPVPAAAAREGSEHSAVTDEKSCMNCHNPHSTDGRSLLKDQPKTICLNCHDREIMVAEGEKTHTMKNIKQKVVELEFPHKPATWDDGCVACHNPHGSKYRTLLLEPFPASNYIDYHPGDNSRKNTYELCFVCHDLLILSKEIAADGTNFRNDTIRDGTVVRQNLHWFHVVFACGSDLPDRGRSCVICHDPHGSEQPHTINAAWTMSNTYQPGIQYKSLPDGGECSKSCHRNITYKRIE